MKPFALTALIITIIALVGCASVPESKMGAIPNQEPAQEILPNWHLALLRDINYKNAPLLLIKRTDELPINAGMLVKTIPCSRKWRREFEQCRLDYSTVLLFEPGNSTRGHLYSVTITLTGDATFKRK